MHRRRLWEGRGVVPPQVWHRRGQNMSCPLGFLASNARLETRNSKFRIEIEPVFPLNRFFSANRRFVGARANNFWQYSKHSFRKFNKFVEIWNLVYFNTGLVRNLGHINAFLELWAQLFKENLGTRWLAIKLEGTQDRTRMRRRPFFFFFWSSSKFGAKFWTKIESLIITKLHKNILRLGICLINKK